MRSKSRWMLFGSIAAVLVACTDKDGRDFITAFAEACGGEAVVVDASDTTAPAAWLRFPDPTTGSAVVLTSGSASPTVPIKASAAVPIWAFAEDPEGAQEIAIVPAVETHCESPGEPTIGEDAGPGLLPDPSMSPYKMASQAVPGETATRRLCALYQVQLKNPCSPGFQFVHSTIEVFAQAKNFNGLATRTPVVTFDVSP